ncbi:hypothetical protein [Candidatus Uabimicrobium sp. HlEnr_7]|uniref:hypothetical protein n=1 Tax=Candidatus Uabimicrobium helgolandensis TaxID=3095367 RepID=UPI00355922A5
MKYFATLLTILSCWIYAEDKIEDKQIFFDKAYLLPIPLIVLPENLVENFTSVVTPIVLDMDGDKKLQASGGQWLPHRFNPKVRTATFDINGDHFAEFMEWVGPKDGLLVRYTKGEINGLNLFGSPGGFNNGFEKLSTLDKNNDKIIDGKELEGLSVWQDNNSDAKVDKGEIKRVQDLKITSLSLKHRMFSSFFIQDGKSKTMWDWHPSIQIIKKIRK